MTALAAGPVRAACPWCLQPVPLREDGRLGSHGRRVSGRRYERCPGSAKMPWLHRAEQRRPSW